MNKCIKVTLNKIFKIEDCNVKDISKPTLELDMKKAKDIIQEASLKACHACNKSAQLWKDYYFNNRYEAELSVNDIDKDEIDNMIEKEYNKRIKSVKDKSKLENSKYVNKIKETSEKYIKSKLIKDAEISIKKMDKERYGKSYQNVVQDSTKKIMKDYNTSNVSQLDQSIVQISFARDIEKMLKYESSIPTFKTDTPYCFHNKNYKLSNTNGYFVDLSIFSKEGYSKHNLKVGTSLKFQIDKLDGNKKATINKIIRGEYKQGSAQIFISKKGKIELIISYSFEPQIKQLDKNRTLGIDLGIVKTATMSIWDSNKVNGCGTKGDWDWFSWKHNVIDGEELIKFRQKQFNINKKRQVSKKYAGDGRVGHGYKTRVKGINNAYVSNFADTYNHKISKYIVDFAIKNNCGIIQMEDLSGATSNTHEKFLKDWSYYDLQKKIEYKSKENGIEFIKVNPKYTSKRCSKCGCIHEDNRNCKEDQGKFECQVCGYKENADINASKNIALPHIDEIIKNTEVIHSKKKAS